MAQSTQTRNNRSRRDRIQTLRLEPYDDVISVRDRLQFMQMRRVLLIFPDNSPILQRKIDLLMIQREAARRHLHIALLTTDPVVMEHAHELNISAFTTTRQARSRRWKQAHNQVFIDRSRPEAPYAYELMGIASRIKPRPTTAQQRRRMIGQLMIGLMIFAALFGLVATVIPGATVTIAPAPDAISQSVIVTVDPAVAEIDIFNNLLPAETVRLLIPEQRVNIEASGRRDADNSLAQGVVVFTNETDTPVYIPEGTIVSTRLSPPQRFRTTSDLALTGSIGATGEVAVIALDESSGLRGNVDPAAIIRVEGALETQVSVRNPNPTFGGGLIQEGVVTAADHERLLTLGRAAVVGAARDELLLQLPTSGKLLLPDSVVLVEERPEWTIYSAEIGEPVESVSLNMRGMVEAVVIDQVQMRQLALILLSRQLPDQREIDEGSLTYHHQFQGVDDQGRAQIRITVQGTTYYAIDEQAVAERINGMSTDAALNTLQREMLLDSRYPPQIDVYPFNIGRVPFLPVRIRVVVVRR